jgi:hypothetical protein
MTYFYFCFSYFVIIMCFWKYIYSVLNCSYFKVYFNLYVIDVSCDIIRFLQNLHHFAWLCKFYFDFITYINFWCFLPTFRFQLFEFCSSSRFYFDLCRSSLSHCSLIRNLKMKNKTFRSFFSRFEKATMSSHSWKIWC